MVGVEKGTGSCSVFRAMPLLETFARQLSLGAVNRQQRGGK